MKKILSFTLVLALIVACFTAINASAMQGKIYEWKTPSENLLPEAATSFETATVNAWIGNTSPYSGYIATLGSPWNPAVVASGDATHGNVMRVGFFNYNQTFTSPTWTLGGFIKEYAEAHSTTVKFKVNISIDAKGRGNNAGLWIRKYKSTDDNTKLVLETAATNSEWKTFSGSFELTYAEATADATYFKVAFNDASAASAWTYSYYDNLVVTIQEYSERNAYLGWAEEGTNLIDSSTFENITAVPAGISTIGSTTAQDITLVASGDDSHGQVLKFYSRYQAYSSAVWAMGAKLKAFALEHPSDKYKLVISTDVKNLSGGGVSLVVRDAAALGASYTGCFSATTDAWTHGSKTFVVDKATVEALGDADLKVCFDGMTANTYHYVDNLHFDVYVLEEIPTRTVEAGNYFNNHELATTSDFAANGCGFGIMPYSAENAAYVHDYDNSVQVYGRSNSWNNIYLTNSVVSTVLTKAGTYVLTEWVYLANNDTVRVKINYGGGKKNAFSNSVSVEANTWTLVTLTFTVTDEMINDSTLVLYTVDTNTTTKYYLDTITISGVYNVFTAANIEIGSSLTLNYYAKLLPDALDATVTFTRNGEADEVLGVLDANTGYYRFTYTGINPQCMTDPIGATLTVGGVDVAEKNGYTVADYCEAVQQNTAAELNISDAELTELKKLMADMLVYGAAAQSYIKYRTDDLANKASWVSANASSYVKPTSVKSATTPVGDDKLTAAGLEFGNLVKIYFRMSVADAEGLTVELYKGSTLIDTANVSDLTFENGKFTYLTEGLKATEFDEAFTLKLMSGVTELHSATYSVNSYVCSMENDAEMGALVKAMCAYGASSKAYNG